MQPIKFVTTSLLCLSMSACMTAGEHRKAVNDDSTEKVTVGTVQKEIRIGMSGADVAAALGSPNIVTSDDQRRETWIYDKISTERAYSSSAGGANALVLAGVGIGGGLLGGGYNSEAGASATTQKTLTVIIKFDSSTRVRDFAYHTSKF